MPWFSRGERSSRRGELLESAIGPSTSLSGIIKSDGGLRIDGHFEGHIDVGGNVVVGESGVVAVDTLIARNITIGGIVRGNIECAGRLEILSSGQVVGDIVADAIMIDQGGVFQGASRMRTAMPALPAPAASPGAAPAPSAPSPGGSAGPIAAGPAAVREPEPALDDVIIDLGPAAPPAAAPAAFVTPPPATEEDAEEAPAPRGPSAAAAPAAAPPADARPARSRAASAEVTSKRANETTPRRADPALDFALDIEPVIPDTGGGSASGAVHQPGSTPAGDGGARRNRRPSGGRRR